MYARLDRTAERVARLMALAGGAVLVALVVITCFSVAGRALIPLGTSPVPGDFELVEMGIGTVVFAFLPWCTYARGHARVDVAAALFGPTGNGVLDVLADLAMLAAALLLAWRHWAGMVDKVRYGETTFVLQLPVWWGYAAGLVGAVGFALVAAFCVLRSACALAGRPE